MDFTCENCKSRFTWDCDDGSYRCKCEYFELDTSTLSEEEEKIFRAIRHVMRENGN